MSNNWRTEETWLEAISLREGDIAEATKPGIVYFRNWKPDVEYTKQVVARLRFSLARIIAKGEPEWQARRNAALAAMDAVEQGSPDGAVADRTGQGGKR